MSSQESAAQKLRAKAAVYRRQIDMFGDELTRKALEREAATLESRASKIESAGSAAKRPDSQVG